MQVRRKETKIMGVIWSSLQIFCLLCCCPKSTIQSMVTSILKRTSGPCSCCPCSCCLPHQQPLSPTCPSPSHPKFKPTSPPDQLELSPPPGSPVASSEPLFGEKVHVPPGTSGGAHPVNTTSHSEATVTTAASPHPLLSSSTPPHAGDEFSRYQHYSAA